MAYIPSHQELRDHPKTRKASAMLSVPRVQMIGHLHLLWWWALSYAPDGDVSAYDATDLALAAEWEGDPEAFVMALERCGPAGHPGFVEGGRLHDWDDYGGVLVERKKRNAERMRDVRAPSGPPSDQPERTRAAHVQRTDEHVQDTCEARGEERREEDKENPPVGPPSALALVAGPADGKPSDAKPKRKRQLPEGWEPNDQHRRMAGQMRVNIGAEQAQFQDHHRSKGSTMLDWDAAFRTWLRNAPKFDRRSIASAPPEAAPKCRACASNQHRACPPAQKGGSCCCVERMASTERPPRAPETRTEARSATTPANRGSDRSDRATGDAA